MNIVCTGKPGDGLLRYSYEHCEFLNYNGYECKLVIITHPKFTKKDYIKALDDQYEYGCDDWVVFDNYTPGSNETTIVLGRSMISLAYKDRDVYTKDQLLSLHLLFKATILAVYSENHPEEYPLALKYFKPEKVVDLCDYDVYPNGVGVPYQKHIHFSIYKPVKNDIQYKHLFLGTTKENYIEIEKVIDDYLDYAIVTYDENWINPKLNNIFSPIENILGKFEKYVYIKPNFDPAPRLIKEFQWLGKEVIYLRDKNIKDGGMIYWNRPILTKQMYFSNINILVGQLELIELWRTPQNG